jgi:hypothetical protein
VYLYIPVYFFNDYLTNKTDCMPEKTLPQRQTVFVYLFHSSVSCEQITLTENPFDSLKSSAK